MTNETTIRCDRRTQRRAGSLEKPPSRPIGPEALRTPALRLFSSLPSGRATPPRLAPEGRRLRSPLSGSDALGLDRKKNLTESENKYICMYINTTHGASPPIPSLRSGPKYRGGTYAMVNQIKNSLFRWVESSWLGKGDRRWRPTHYYYEQGDGVAPRGWLSC